MRVKCLIIKDMNVTNLIDQGVQLMMLGMGMVFFILGLLVVVIKIASALIMKYEPVSVFNLSEHIDDDIVTAISEAVQRYRSK